ncbi:hypothetical protein BJV74DRAFT_811649 [Russula compacta]|nr:hypothetical protein BJV74DRAFT_811649 [Russula compacta]
MVDFRDPAVATHVVWVYVMFLHTLFGLYIWEFFTTLDYEWSVIRGHRPYRWSFWIYSATRAATLMAEIISIVDLDVISLSRYNCQVFVTLQFTSSYVAVAAASLLIVLRIIAIWNRNRVVVVIALVTWGTNFSIVIYGAVKIRMWMPDEDTCSIANPEKSTLDLNSIFALVTNIVLLLIMLVGLLRLRRHGGGSFALAQLLWKQGLIWLLVATIAEVPPVVLINLNLNEPLDIISHFPALITMSIAATRMHRALGDVASRPIEITQEPTGGNIFPKIKPTTVPMRFRELEVSMHTVDEQYPTPRMSHQSLCIDTNMDGQRHDKMS